MRRTERPPVANTSAAAGAPQRSATTRAQAQQPSAERNRSANRESAPAGLTPRAQRPLRTPDLELASYFLAREVTGQPVAAASQDLLRRTNESKKEVLDTLSYGRSNVAPDLQATDNAGLYRLRAQRVLVGNRSSLSEPPAEQQLQQAAITAAAGTGNCSEHARLAAHVHAARLLPGEQVQVIHALEADHGWAEVRGAEQGDRPPAVAVLDVWGDGPVVEPRDAHFRRQEVGPLSVDHTLHAHHAAHTQERFFAARERVISTQSERMKKMVAVEAAKARPHPGPVYDQPVPTVTADLAQAARAAIVAHSPRSLSAKAQAAVMACCDDAHADQAQAAAETVARMACDLLAPRERPLMAANPGAMQAPESVSSDTDGLGVDSDAEEPVAKRQRTGESLS